jgi:hypothetical protein
MATSQKSKTPRTKINSTSKKDSKRKLKSKKSSIQKPFQKKSRRSKTQYPALHPELNLRSRTELLDYDYIHKLSDKEKKFLNKFTEEYVNASLDVKKKWRNLHKTKETIRDCFNRNNARNRDVLTQQKAMGKHLYLEEVYDVGKSEYQAIDDKIDMELLGITDKNGNLLIEEADILQYCKERGYDSSKPSKKSDKLK